MGSSPVIYPSSPASPGRTKRSRPSPDVSRPAAALPMTTGGFMIDSDSDSDSSIRDGPAPKKRMLAQPTTSTNDIPPFSLSQALPVRETKVAVMDEFDDDYILRPQSQSQSQGLPTTKVPIWEGSVFQTGKSYVMTGCNGRTRVLQERQVTKSIPYEELVSARSKKVEGRATKSYYGIPIHKLVENAQAELKAAKILKEERDRKKAEAMDVEEVAIIESVETTGKKGSKKHSLWTEKYRAKKFMDLCGDDTTNRHVLRWIKAWDPLVFPGSRPPKPVNANEDDDERQHRKILLLTGPPGLGKTTLAHVCARQAGYDVLEINASDDRSRDVVKGRIRTSLGTETVKTVTNRGDGDKPRIARPLCVVVDEVDGVTSGSGAGGDGGFIKALMDLVTLGEKNAAGVSSGTKSKKGKDDFRQMRPLILICNDIYAPSLRPLRMSNLAEIIHVGKPTIDHVVNRLIAVFSKEKITCERDAARKLCEAAWGVASGQEARRGVESAVEGDLRGVMVVAQWVASRFRAQTAGEATKPLSRVWLEKHVLQELQSGSGGGRGTGRGSVRDIVTRVFQEGAGFPKPALGEKQAGVFMAEQPQGSLGFSEHHKKHGIAQLEHMIEASNEHDRVMSDIFAEYPNREYTDDSALGKPNEAYEWMHFHDTCSSKLFRDQDWELAAYMSQPIIACHSLFAAPIRQAATNYRRREDPTDENSANPASQAFSGPRAAFLASEAEKATRHIIQSLQDGLSARLLRAFRSPESIATEFLPYLTRMVAPDVKPVVINGAGPEGKSTASVRKESEKRMVKRAAEVMADVGMKLVRGKVEGDMLRGPQWVFRFEPDIDHASVYPTLARPQPATRYAVRQVLSQELRLVLKAIESASRQARFTAGGGIGTGMPEIEEDTAMVPASQAPQVVIKRDFFGRVTEEVIRKVAVTEIDEDKVNVWIRYHEGLNNAVRKPISVDEFLKGL